MGFSWDWITPNLATGGKVDSTADIATLQQAGVTHVLNLATEDDQHQAFQQVLKDYVERGVGHVPAYAYCWNPTEDDGNPKGVEWFKASLDFALPALRFPDSKVYVHCRWGINRGPSTAYACLRAVGCTPWQARWTVYWARWRTVFGLRYVEDAEVALKELGYTNG